MRVVLITGEGPEHKYVANRLAREVGLARIVVDREREQTRLGRLLWLRRKYGTLGLCSRVLLRLLGLLWGYPRERAAQLFAVLGAAMCAEFIDPELLRPVRGINSAEGRAAVAAADPDLVMIYGTGIVGRRVLALGRRPPLNLHTGLSPEYRGSDCAFWPIYDGRLDMLGATVHECTPKVDGGRIYAQSRAALEAGDGLFAVFGRCVVAGTDSTVQVLNALAQGELEGRAQDLSRGREFHSTMRGVAAELRVRRLMREGCVERYLAERDRVLEVDGEAREGVVLA